MDLLAFISFATWITFMDSIIQPHCCLWFDLVWFDLKAM